jgi:transcriptional regulator with XRE-family HTH domain
MELDHKMDKKLKIAEIAARTGLSASTVSRVLAGKRIPATRRAGRCWSARASWG